MKKTIIIIISCFLWCFPALAAETPSDADELTYLDILNTLLDDIDYDDLSEEEKIDLLSVYISSLSGPGLASSSNADLSAISSDVSAIRSAVAPISDDDDTENDEIEISVASDDSELSLSAYASDLPDLGIDRNVTIYKGSWNGSSCYLVIPAELESCVWISDDGYLFNVGSSSITGRLFYDDFAYDDFEYSQVTLQSIYSAQSSVYSYGYPNYVRDYYESSSRLTYSTTYGNFTVTETIHTNSDDIQYKCYYILIILFMVGGVLILCFYRK